MRYALISYDNIFWTVDLRLFRTRTEAEKVMKEYFDGDLRVMLLRYTQVTTPLDYAAYANFCTVWVTKDSIEARFHRSEDQFRYEIIEISPEDLQKAGIREFSD